MEFPEKIQCHGEIDPIFTYADEGIVWRDKSDEHARSCSYCGSLHPEDLVYWLEHKGMQLSGADWKYGWAHKFYLVGGPSQPIKFYNVHLKDLPPETFEYVAKLIARYTQIWFELDASGRLSHYAPYRGYQAVSQRERTYLDDLLDTMNQKEDAADADKNKPPME